VEFIFLSIAGGGGGAGRFSKTFTAEILVQTAKYCSGLFHLNIPGGGGGHHLFQTPPSNRKKNKFHPPPPEFFSSKTVVSYLPLEMATLVAM
jgi:hypothetical protein